MDFLNDLDNFILWKEALLLIDSTFIVMAKIYSIRLLSIRFTIASTTHNFVSLFYSL